MDYDLIYPIQILEARGQDGPLNSKFLWISVGVKLKKHFCLVMQCVCVIPFILDVRFVDVPAGVTQEDGHTGFLHLPSAVLALIVLTRRIQPFLSLVDRELEFCTNELIVLGVWEREAHINWSMVTCQGRTRSELP